MNKVAYCWPPEPRPGDTVRLRSGGPPMTFAGIDGNEAVVAYWRAGELVVASLPLSALERCDD